jgi:putative ABC transport system substrate-binding protein
MATLGLTRDRNIEIVTRVTENRPEVVALIHELVRAKVDLILVFGSGPTGGAKAATSTIPIVFSIHEDPAVDGLVASLTHPGGNLTGFAIQPYDDKLLQILKEALPQMPLVAFPEFGPHALIERAAGALGMRVISIRMGGVDRETDVPAFYAAVRKAGAGAVLIAEHPAIKSRLERFATDARTHGLPAIAYARSFAEAGGLIAYGPNPAREFQTLAIMINKILKGTKPADIPIELPTSFDLVINQATASALGITIPKPLMLRATEVIR